MASRSYPIALQRVLRIYMYITQVMVGFSEFITCMSQTECPESQVRSSVGDAAQTVLYRVNGLFYHHIPKIKLQKENGS